MGRQIVERHEDALRLGIVNLGESRMQVAKSSAARRSVTFTLRPGRFHVEEDEQVRRAVAPVLAVVALDLSRLGRDRQAGLADELNRALVEANHGPLRVGRLGVEIEHVLHAGDAIRVEGGLHPMSLRHGLSLFSARRRGAVSRDRLSWVVTLTSVSASSSSVQRARPAGGLEQAAAARRFRRATPRLRRARQKGPRPLRRRPFRSVW